MTQLPVPVVSIGLLLCSNIFMTTAWYGHLKFPTVSLWRVTAVSWGIAFFEYCFQIPANRYGYGYFSAAELKTIQEVLSLTVFMVFSIFYLDEPLKWNYVLGFALIVFAAFVIFHKW
ncbi:MAG: DMT family protein [Betaproteobacteria bacterium]|nr:DMT family protein [Betaproteobacteria bacterium]